MKIQRIKPAIAMIELIFALVIMGIVLLSAPMLIQESIRSGNVALQQEAIATVAAQTGVILSMNWDENNSNYEAGTSPILDTNRILAIAANPLNFNGGNLAGLNGVSGRVSSVGGTIILSPATTFGTDETNESDTNESTFIDFDDIDDYENSNLGIRVYNNEDTTADKGDYIDVALTMNTHINYAEDRPRGNVLNTPFVRVNLAGSSSRINRTALGTPSNIKFIHVELTSNSGIAELNKSIVMKAFSCNIGTYLPKGDEKL